MSIKIAIILLICFIISANAENRKGTPKAFCVVKNSRFEVKPPFLVFESLFLEVKVYKNKGIQLLKVDPNKEGTMYTDLNKQIYKLIEDSKRSSVICSNTSNMITYSSEPYYSDLLIQIDNPKFIEKDNDAKIRTYIRRKYGHSEIIYGEVTLTEVDDSSGPIYENNGRKIKCKNLYMKGKLHRDYIPLREAKDKIPDSDIEIFVFVCDE